MMAGNYYHISGLVDIFKCQLCMQDFFVIQTAFLFILLLFGIVYSLIVLQI